jgi:hypothetical protein
MEKMGMCFFEMYAEVQTYSSDVTNSEKMQMPFFIFP